jgi:hypothetical protein
LLQSRHMPNAHALVMSLGAGFVFLGALGYITQFTPADGLPRGIGARSFRSAVVVVVLSILLMGVGVVLYTTAVHQRQTITPTKRKTGPTSRLHCGLAPRSGRHNTSQSSSRRAPRLTNPIASCEPPPAARSQ